MSNDLASMAAEVHDRCCYLRTMCRALLFLAMAAGCATAPTPRAEIAHTSPVTVARADLDGPTTAPVPAADGDDERQRAEWTARVAPAAVRGGLQLADVAATVSGARTPLTHKCRRKVGARVKLSVDLTVEAHGKVSRALVVDGDGEAPLPACVVAELLQLSLPARERPSTLVVTVEWVSSDEPAKQRTVDEVMAVIMSHRHEIRKTCHAHVPIGGSRVLLHFVVSPSGAVIDLRPDTDNPPLGECIQSQVAGWSFPAADEPTPVDVPFVLMK
jgi:hypothetical protein